jgi:hypothetical protein
MRFFVSSLIVTAAAKSLQMHGASPMDNHPSLYEKAVAFSLSEVNEKEASQLNAYKQRLHTAMQKISAKRPELVKKMQEIIRDAEAIRPDLAAQLALRNAKTAEMLSFIDEKNLDQESRDEEVDSMMQRAQAREAEGLADYEAWRAITEGLTNGKLSRKEGIARAISHVQEAIKRRDEHGLKSEANHQRAILAQLNSFMQAADEADAEQAKLEAGLKKAVQVDPKLMRMQKDVIHELTAADDAASISFVEINAHRPNKKASAETKPTFDLFSLSQQGNLLSETAAAGEARAAEWKKSGEALSKKELQEVTNKLTAAPTDSDVDEFLNLDVGKLTADEAAKTLDTEVGHLLDYWNKDKSAMRVLKQASSTTFERFKKAKEPMERALQASDQLATEGHNYYGTVSQLTNRMLTDGEDLEKRVNKVGKQISDAMKLTQATRMQAGDMKARREAIEQRLKEETKDAQDAMDTVNKLDAKHKEFRIKVSGMEPKLHEIEAEVRDGTKATTDIYDREKKDDVALTSMMHATIDTRGNVERQMHVVENSIELQTQRARHQREEMDALHAHNTHWNQTMEEYNKDDDGMDDEMFRLRGQLKQHTETEHGLSKNVKRIDEAAKTILDRSRDTQHELDALERGVDELKDNQKAAMGHFATLKHRVVNELRDADTANADMAMNAETTKIHSAQTIEQVKAQADALLSATEHSVR